VRFYIFVKNNHKLINTPYRKRQHVKINVLMSEAIQSKTAVQCHSHFQKMMQKYKTVGKMLRKLRVRLEINEDQ
jgi:hypothetical protein